MSREAFLSRVRQAATAGRSYRVHVGEIPPGTGYVGARSADLCAAMADEVNEVGGIAHLVDNLELARSTVHELLGRYRARRVLAWEHDVLTRMRLGALLAEMSVEHFDHGSLAKVDRQSQRAAMLSADVGITSCDLAIAETGSLIVCSRPGQERAASLVTPVHIAVVERAQIVPDLFDAFERLWSRSTDLPEVAAVDPRAGQSQGPDRSGDLTHVPSNAVIITGPSKTGDIELTLTTGVHGPGKWHVVIVTSPTSP
jgi:L-lactate utilization protein LutC